MIHDAPITISATSGTYWDYAPDWSEGEWSPWADGDDTQDDIVVYVRADRIQSLEAEVARLSKPIDMQDVRLRVGEGKLTNADILAGVNAEIRARAALVQGDDE